MTTIALTAPTGKVGTAVLAAAREHGILIRALARDATRVAPAAAETVPFDFADPATYAPALAGVGALILVAPSSPRQADEEIAVVDAAHRAGVHVVKLSVSGAENGGMTFANLHQRVERHLTAAGIASTFLRPTFFMQNALGAAAAIRGGIYAAAMGNARIGQIDAADIAAVALRVASAPSEHVGRAYELTGPAAYTGEELASALATAAQRPVRYVDLSEDELRAGLTAAGLDAWYVQGYLELYQIVRAGYTQNISGDVAAVTGRAPRDFGTWSHMNAAAFQ